MSILKDLHTELRGIKGHKVQLYLLNRLLYCTTNPDLDFTDRECGDFLRQKLVYTDLSQFC